MCGNNVDCTLQFEKIKGCTLFDKIPKKYFQIVTYNKSYAFSFILDVQDDISSHHSIKK